MNHLSLSEIVCILPLFLKDIFTWYRMLAWQIFSFSILTIFFFPLLAFIVCEGEWAVIWIIHVFMSFFSLATSIFSGFFFFFFTSIKLCIPPSHTWLPSSGCGHSRLCPLVLHSRETVGFFKNYYYWSFGHCNEVPSVAVPQALLISTHWSRLRLIFFFQEAILESLNLWISRFNSICPWVQNAFGCVWQEILLQWLEQNQVGFFTYYDI